MGFRKIALAAMLAGAPIVALYAQDGPESLLPPGFDDPAPAPTPAPAPRRTAAPTPAPGGSVSQPVVQSVPDSAPNTGGATSRAEAARRLLDRLPSLDDLEKMDTDEIDELLGLKPSFDIPPAARRSTDVVGLLAASEGGMARNSLTNYDALFVRRVLDGTKGPLVSRWGHILLRRALASRLAAPTGMDGVEFAALRAGLLNRMGEPVIARALVQEVDSADYSPALIGAAYDAYVGTGDFTGACPMVRLHARAREDRDWELLRGICSSFSGESGGMDRIERQRRRSEGTQIDSLLAQKYAGAVGRARRAVTLEWEDVDELTPWRYALATATGAEVPNGLLTTGGATFQRMAAVSPSVPLIQRAQGSEVAAAEGILSSAALVDLYSQIYSDPEIEGDEASRAAQLREAYVGDPEARLTAMRNIWGDTDGSNRFHSRQVLTAYAAARLTPDPAFEADAGWLIGSMLAAGLDANAVRWANTVQTGSHGWGLLMLGSPALSDVVSESAVRSFIEEDESARQQRSRFFVAGLAGLGRLAPDKAQELSGVLNYDIGRETRWTRAIDRAAARNNRVLVSYLVALGMQGSSWRQMTPVHLYHIVKALNDVGLTAEARMIAAEAVARS
ncbi:hypothetical protein [Croceicoccus naphthovorans]|uniref:Uncharacterized protein n=1 Tax=Croceicoccus naphthovorans TaxID=1348774 RepID=A0A0G3XM99_9SPHN|nr:hypothetical protein [Croceicoccus naphthovorans]AKM11766.1 hypothetical protein AB433_11205 [Croceicoccus naphthovorans]MBB3990097.1 hypothetical protein [Croceicoccus naphthovorans]